MACRAAAADPGAKLPVKAAWQWKPKLAEALKRIRLDMKSDLQAFSNWCLAKLAT